MEEYRYFRQLSDPQIHAALIGISKLDWIHAKYNQSKEDVASMMYSNQFDVLPLLNKNGTYTQFYKTSVWGNYQKENITWKNIDEKNSIYYLTSLRDVFKQFNNQKVNYFFLSNHSEAIGLITIGNLNCKHVYLYFYNLINQLEKKLTKFLVQKISRDAIINLLKSYSDNDKLRSSSKDTLLRFFTDSETGVDADIVEYLYLSEIFMICRDKKLYKYLGYSSENKFCYNNSKIKNIRNIVSHPNKSLVKNSDSITDIWIALLKIEDLLSKIDQNVSS